MALSAATAFEVRTAGADTNGGGFVAGATGTDYSQQNSAQYSGVDLTVDATTNTKVSSASHNFVAADVGNLIRVSAGTGWTVGFYQIVSVAANAATLDRSPAAVTTTGGTWAEGGAVLSPALVEASVIAGHTVYYKSGTYLLTSTTSNIVGGVINCNVGGSATARIRRIGYTTTRGDGAPTKPIFRASGIASITLVTLNNANSYNSLENVEVDGNSLSGIIGINVQGRNNWIRRCTIRNTTSTGVTCSSNAMAELCEVTGSTAGGNAAFTVNSGTLWGCTSHDNAARGFDIRINGVLSDCLSYNNTGSEGHGFFVYIGYGLDLVRCVAYNDAQHGFYVADNSVDMHAINCIAANNGGYGFNHASAPANVSLLNCAGYLNTSGNYPTGTSLPIVIENFQALSTSPFVAAGSNDFRLNTTAGGGASCRGTGLPSSWPGNSLTVSAPDIGAAQHADSGGGVVQGAIIGGS